MRSLDAQICHLLALVGTIAALPAVYFVIGNILTFELGLFPGVEIQPIAPAILLGGCLIAALLNVWPVLGSVRADQGLRSWFAEVVQARKSNLVVLGIGTFFLLFLLTYAVLENLVPH